VIRRLVICLVCVATAVALDAPIVRADNRTCNLDPDTGELKCVLVASPVPAVTVRLTVDLPLEWSRIPLNVDELISRGHGCTRSNAGVTEIGVGYVITLTNGVARTTSSCGSEAAPSLTWTPQAAGQYSVTLTTVWAGSWDLSFGGAAMGTFPLGPIRLTGPVEPYPVGEYRGELTG
jgi:hypothetical protein